MLPAPIVNTLLSPLSLLRIPTLTTERVQIAGEDEDVVGEGGGVEGIAVRVHHARGVRHVTRITPRSQFPFSSCRILIDNLNTPHGIVPVANVTHSYRGGLLGKTAKSGNGSNHKPDTSHNPVIHSPTRQHRDTVTGRFAHCAGDACPQCHADSNGHEPVSLHACPGGHEQWITVATDSPGRLRLYRHIQTHYDVQLAMKMLTRYGIAGVSFAAMMADAFCTAGLLATHGTNGTTAVPRFAYFKSPLNDYRESMARGDKPTLDFVMDLLLTGQWKKEDLAGFAPSNIIQFDPHRSGGRTPHSAA